MNVYSAKDIEAEATQMLDKNGKKYVLVVIKKSFTMPMTVDTEPQALENNWELLFDDLSFAEYVGNTDVEPGSTPSIFENDFVFRKQKCDVVINAKAYLPKLDKNKPHTHTTVNQDKEISFKAGFAVDKTMKLAQVYATNVADLMANDKTNIANPQPVWLHYGSTYGGLWEPEDPEKEEMAICFANPMGVGFLPEKQRKKASLKKHKSFGITLPRVYYTEHKDLFAKEQPQPCAFSQLARHADPRKSYAGTYDQQWKDDVFPYLPQDFDERFFQCVPEDQQIAFPQGGEQVKFINMHPEHDQIVFNLPKLEMPVVLKDKNSDLHELEPVIDTLQFDVEKQEFAMVWRCHYPLKRSIREVEAAVIGCFDEDKRAELLGCADGSCGGGKKEPCCGGCAEGKGCEGDDDKEHKHKPNVKGNLGAEHQHNHKHAHEHKHDEHDHHHH